MRINVKQLIIAIAIPLLTGGVSALLSRNMDAFKMLNKPPLSPPGWLFPIAWTVLYTLMGIASYLVYTSSADKNKIRNAITCYGVQLFFNFCWSIIFFTFEAYLVALIWLIILWVLILCTIFKFYDISKTAAYFLISYILWVTFALYLNAGIWWLN